MKIELASIEMDTSIQCRASIDTGVVDEYAERIREGDKFPPVVLFGSAERSWIGDGWHRVMAYQQRGFVQVEADMRSGGRAEALKHALGANTHHGHRRTNPDKRRCVEIAVAEFPDMSSRAIAGLIGINDKTVEAHRPVNCGSSAVETRLGLDGKRRRVERSKPEPVEVIEEMDETENVEMVHQDESYFYIGAIQRAYLSLNDKGKTAFREWLETIK